jgi:4-amino-4-deoxy-L-arabinose transferase-like glycosyltransferase
MSTKPTSTLAGPVAETRAVATALEAVLLLVAAIFLGLHYVHLKADFPNHSVWADWSKYTDEGWYGDAAIRHYQLGHWNAPGDFNPAAALPVWPAIELVVFRFTGVSLVAARALTVTIFGVNLVLCYLLMRRWFGAGSEIEAHRKSLAPALAVLLLAVNPFLFVFSRLAILEPLLILVTLMALLTASAAGKAMSERANRRSIALSIALGLLLPLMVLSKTTGIFLFPAIFWLLLAACGYKWKPFLRVAVVAAGVGAVGWGAYYGLFVRPHYLLDYRYLFSANAYTGITKATFWSVLHDTIFDIVWMGGLLYLLALIAVVGSVLSLCAKRFRGNALVIALLLWSFGYAAFLAYHDNLSPRYFVVVAVPLTMLVAIVFEPLLASGMGTFSRVTDRVGEIRAGWIDVLLLRMTAALAAVALIFVAYGGASQTIDFVRHPEYTWVSAADQFHATIERELAASRAQGGAGHSPLVMSISGSDLSLMTGLPSICDDFGTMTLPDRVAKYRPGWFATWNDVEDDKMDALAPMYTLVRVATVPAFDDPDRNLFILYRLDPVGTPGSAGRPGRRRSMTVPRRLQTKVGEQPSAAQLKH